MGTSGAMPRCTARGRPPPGPCGGSVALRRRPSSQRRGAGAAPLGASLGPGGRPRRMSRRPTPPDPTSAPASAPSPVPRGPLRQLQARSHPLCPEPPQATPIPGSENLGGQPTGEPPASPLLLALEAPKGARSEGQHPTNRRSWPAESVPLLCAVAAGVVSLGLPKTLGSGCSHYPRFTDLKCQKLRG